MIPQRFRVLLWVGPLIALGWLLMVAVRTEPQPKPWEYVTIGLVFGTLFGQATLSSAWTALGPFPLVWRLVLSLGWLGALVVALAINMEVHGLGADLGLWVLFGIAILSQWLLAQLPLWVLVRVYGLQVRHASERNLAATGRNVGHSLREWPAARVRVNLSSGGSRSESPTLTGKERQFGIRQLMILTAIVAIVLGIGRIAMPPIVRSADLDARPVLIITMLAVSGILMMLPLLLAALLPRLALPATLFTLFVIGLGTAAELPLLTILHGPIPGGGPHVWHFLGINVFQAAWVLAVAGALRLSGFELSASRPQ